MQFDELVTALDAISGKWLEANQATDFRAWTLSLDDSHENLMRMGTDVADSCQKVDGDPRLNQGLAGSALDGKMRIAIIQDGSGKIIGRAILRLMKDEQGNACLLMDTIYPHSLNPLLALKLRNFAISQVEPLGMDLVRPPDRETSEEHKPGFTYAQLRSGDLKFPVYSDAAEGIQTDEFFLQSHVRMYRHAGGMPVIQ
jgi:hypothetical protein